jgi:hypothetical protein
MNRLAGATDRAPTSAAPPAGEIQWADQPAKVDRAVSRIRLWLYIVVRSNCQYLWIKISWASIRNQLWWMVLEINPASWSL